MDTARLIASKQMEKQTDYFSGFEGNWLKIHISEYTETKFPSFYFDIMQFDYFDCRQTVEENTEMILSCGISGSWGCNVEVFFSFSTPDHCLAATGFCLLEASLKMDFTISPLFETAGSEAFHLRMTKRLLAKQIYQEMKHSKTIYNE